MWDYLPKPLPIHNELKCPQCNGRFKFREKDKIHQGLTCPHCERVSKFSDCISEEAIFYELTLARKKMEAALFKSRRKQGYSWLLRLQRR